MLLLVLSNLNQKPFGVHLLKMILKHFSQSLSLLCLLLMPFLSLAQNALDFDGSDDQVTVANASALIANSSSMSMGFWVYPTTNSTGWPNFDGYAGFRNDANADFYILQLGSNNVEARIRNSGGTNYTITYNGGLNLNAWNHLVLSYNGSTLILYHDGAFAASTPATGTISSSTEAFNIGFTPFTGNNFYFDGRIDDLGLWKRALSASDVSSLYNACGPDLNDSTLVLSY
ncbi:MAG: LamG domain-containing protein, partial [Croceimicrobium sp.]